MLFVEFKVKNIAIVRDYLSKDYCNVFEVDIWLLNS